MSDSMFIMAVLDDEGTFAGFLTGRSRDQIIEKSRLYGLRAFGKMFSYKQRGGVRVNVRE